MRDDEIAILAESLLATIKRFPVSPVGTCGGKCKGWNEDSIEKLCDTCLAILNETRDSLMDNQEIKRLFDNINSLSGNDVEKLMNKLEQIVNFDFDNPSSSRTH